MTENKDNIKRSFTQKDLEAFDGKEGHPFYVVFNGKVYDLSKSQLWIKGTHMGIHTRNENLAETIKGAPHPEDILERFPVVGMFGEQPMPAPPLPTTMEKEVAEVSAKQPAQPLAMDRRNFLKLATAGGGAITILALASSIKAFTFIPAATTQLAWPKITVTNIKSLKLLTPVTFNYPLTNTPNLLVKLGVTAKGGVGPDKDIVAFSDICQHLGCFYGFVPPSGSPPCNKSYKASLSEGYCCCHGSQYDFVDGAKVIGGPAPRPVPQVQLEYDASTGNINALSMGPPTIYGHGPPGTTDPALVLKYDLQGGEVVSGA
jgi:arsenite oxidase small subunit